MSAPAFYLQLVLHLLSLKRAKSIAKSLAPSRWRPMPDIDAGIRW